MKFQQSGTLRSHMNTHKDKVQDLHLQVEKQKEQLTQELDIIEIEDGQVVPGEQHNRRQMKSKETTVDSEEGIEISQDELLNFNIDDCVNGNSVFSGE